MPAVRQPELGATWDNWDKAHRLTEDVHYSGDKPNNVRGELELRNVEFAYPERPTISVFRKFDLVIEEGKIVALCGQSGSGKSSIIALVLRFYDPLQGSVSFLNCWPNVA